MAEFVQTMKDWRRMCKHYSDESVKDGQNSCVDTCPLGHNTACGIMENALDSDIKDLAKEVEKWAAEHPEPVYPTWLEYLARYCGAPQKIDFSPIEFAEEVHGVLPETYIHWLMTHRIPADIAEKLGVRPKEIDH